MFEGPIPKREQDQKSEEDEWRAEPAEAERRELAESQRQFATNESVAVKQRESMKKRGAADRSFALAAEFARNQMRSDGLDGEIRPHYEVRYSVAQGLKAAVHGREDAATTLVLQRDILIRLDSIKVATWIAMCLLLYIAYRLS